MMRKKTPVKIGMRGAKLMKVRLSWVKKTKTPPMIRPKIPIRSVTIKEIELI